MVADDRIEVSRRRVPDYSGLGLIIVNQLLNIPPFRVKSVLSSVHFFHIMASESAPELAVFPLRRSATTRLATGSMKQSSLERKSERQELLRPTRGLSGHP